MIKIALVDDEDKLKNEVKDYILKYSSDNNIDIDINMFSSGEDFISNFNKFSFDIIFMDIMMKNLDGIETCQKIRKIDQDVIIIFLTNLVQYALKGYEVNALDFVVKPVNYNVLKMKLDRAVTSLKNRKKSTNISFSYQNKKIFLETSKIKYVEVTGHKLVFYTTEGEYCTYELSLSKLEKILSENEEEFFCRCNNYLLVNLNYVTSLSNLTLTIENKELMVSRSKKNQLMEKISKLYSQGKY